MKMFPTDTQMSMVRQVFSLDQASREPVLIQKTNKMSDLEDRRFKHSEIEFIRFVFNGAVWATLSVRVCVCVEQARDH